MDRGACSGSCTSPPSGSSPSPSSARICTAAHVCFKSECCPMFMDTSLCHAFTTSYSSTSQWRRWNAVVLIDVSCKMSLKPSRSFFSPKSKGLWKPGEFKCLQMWAAWLIPYLCQHCRGSENREGPLALAGLCHGTCGAPAGRRVSWPAWSSHNPAFRQHGVGTPAQLL